jgi:signal transduction histidine kinase
LEHKIQERTTELLQSNKLLQQEIIERKQMGEKLKWAKEAAEAANLAKTQFLANMSHELRTPLNVIIGYSEMLEEEAVDLGCENVTPDLEKICVAGKHLLGLINDILDITKIESGKMTLNCETFNLSMVITEMTTTVQSLMEKQGNTFKINIDENLGEMYADVTKLRQILLNLLSNAARFTENGLITLIVTDNENKWFDFKVTDTGIGMTNEQIQNLFQFFTQVDSSPTRKYDGAGLGLAITKQFTEMMGGSISVESELEDGSTFIVRLPSICQ